ncbi:tlde1 domain-containing protein [Bradyrhizobium sp. URHC0002]
MSKRMRAYGPAVHNRRKPSRKGIPQYFLGSVAVAGLVLGCAWTVYTNVFGANVYPSVNSAAFVAPAVKDTATVAARPVRPAFNEIFASLEQQSLVIPAPENVASSLMFNERFAASAAQGEPSRSVGYPPVEATKLAEASPPAEAPKAVQAPKLVETPKPKVSAPATKLALNIPASTPKEVEPKIADDKAAKASSGSPVRDMAQRAKAAVMSIASNEKQSMVEKLWGKQPASGGFLAYASADASVTGSIIDTRSQNPMMGGAPPYDRQTAVYDIAAQTVYLPDGTRLEAHSGLGSKMDDVRYSHVRMQGVTPPHIYELKPRETLFHGVPALRLTPLGGEEKIHGRDGLLAHTYMLGPSGQSNGCVSFKDYYAFLDAYKNKGIRRLAVLAKVQ